MAISAASSADTWRVGQTLHPPWRTMPQWHGVSQASVTGIATLDGRA
ncbi:hypothetical protein ACLUUI_17160 [Enterobacterales bacterium AW_CKDN230030176-1A_HGKHYDSX7]